MFLQPRTTDENCTGTFHLRLGGDVRLDEDDIVLTKLFLELFQCCVADLLVDVCEQHLHDEEQREAVS